MSKHTPGVMRAAKLVLEAVNAGNESLDDIATIISEQTAQPDLLEACEQIIEAADDPDNGKDRDLVEAIEWDHLRAAIAKAKGGQQ